MLFFRVLATMLGANQASGGAMDFTLHLLNPGVHLQSVNPRFLVPVTITCRWDLALDRCYTKVS